MNQIIKTEIIIGLITTAKSKVSFDIFQEKKKTKPNRSRLDNQQKILKKLDNILNDFYSKLETSDNNYNELVRQIKVISKKYE